jgi:hypothetical protein
MVLEFSPRLPVLPLSIRLIVKSIISSYNSPLKMDANTADSGSATEDKRNNWVRRLVDKENLDGMDNFLGN